MPHADATFLCPLPRLHLDAPYVLDPGFTFSPLSAEVRRALLNAAKSNSNCSDRTLELLHNTDAVVTKASPSGDDSFLHTVLYRSLFESMAVRILESFLVSTHYSYIRAPVLPKCSFLIHGAPDALDLENVVAMEPDWRPRDLREEAWVTDKSFDASAVLKHLAELWPRLSRMCDPGAIGNLINLTDESRQSRYRDAGNKWVNEKTIGFAQIVASEPSPTADGETLHDLSSMRVSKDISAGWFITGYLRAFFDELDEAKSQLRKTDSQVRLKRAWQVFVGSSYLEEPHRLVNMVTTLESLLSSSPSELRYQLATRVAWMLVPSKPSTDVAKLAIAQEVFDEQASSDPDRIAAAMDALKQLGHDANASEIKSLLDRFPQALSKRRMQAHNEISGVYGLRSKIVHGDIFDWKKIEEQGEVLRETIKTIFEYILRDESVFEIFMSTDKKKSNEFLKALPLGG